MYKLSARQILTIALLSAVFAAGTVACYDRFGSRLQPVTSAFGDNNAAADVSGITDPSVATDERNNIEVYRTISPGVVYITSLTRPRGFFDRGGKGTGSGSVIDDQGHILTNNHVVEDADSLSVSFGTDKSYPAKTIGRDPDTDLAIIKVEAPREVLRPVPLGDSDRLSVGQKVLAIGNPFGLDRTLTTGVISGLQRPIEAQTGRIIEGAIQTDASINPGNSGGPLLDSQGRMIGINSQILSPAGGSVGVGFAVPVNIAKRIVPQLIREGRVVRPKLSVYSRNVADIRGVRLPVEQGVLIVQVIPNGTAAAAGLRGLNETPEGDLVLGDIVTAIDGEKVSDQNDLFRILDKHQFNDTVKIEVVRDGRRANIPVRLLPEQRGTVRR
ncbi:MAG TPA: trypsin-like peptidase domain-containing protein [Pyrinomonadaceae bacterium]|nr:trypsin-like peptidase domain-containing protein [Pyrinomonadaceae bacterium]